MAFMIKEIIDLKGILLLVLLTIPSEATNLDCHGKAFHCVNSSHFMICVDLGTGISMTIDDVVIPCPTPTVCRPTNRFECEFLPTSTSVPIEVSTIANIVTSPESEIATFIPLDTTSIPFEEYFNTLSPTTLSESVQQTTESPLTVHLSTSTRVSDITRLSKSTTVITDESVSRNATANPGTTTDVSTESNKKQNDVSNSYTDQIQNTILNLDVIPYKAGVTNINNQKVATGTDALSTQGTDSSILNTQHNYLGDATSTSITEQTKIIEELFTPSFQDLSVNAIIPEHLSITSYTTVEPTTQIEEIISASDATNNTITVEPGSFSVARTNIETTTNIISKNITNTSVQNEAPIATSISDQLNVNGNNTQYEVTTDIITTRAITEGVPNNTYYKEPFGSTSTPVHVAYNHNNLSSASDSKVTAEYIKEVKAIVNISESNTESLINNMNTGDNSTTEAYAYFSNIANANNKNDNIEINRNISYKRNNATMDENKQDFSTGAIAQEPVTEYLSSSTDSKNLEKFAPFDIDTTTLATIKSESLIQDIVTSSINLPINPNIAYYNNNLEILSNPSTTVMTVLNLGTENVIDNSQSDTEINGNNFNNTMGNTTPVFKSELNSETSTHSTYDIEQAHEFSTMSEPSFLKEATQLAIAKNSKKNSTANLNLDSLNKTTLQTETTTSSAFATLSTILHFSPISTINESDIVSATKTTNEINGNINIAQDPYNFTFKDTQVVTTNEPSKVTNIVSTNEPTHEIIFLDQSKLTVTAVETINKLSTKTDTVEPYNILSTEHIESLSQTSTIPKDTSTSLPTTDTINKLSTKTDTVEPYNILSTEHIESLSQTSTIPKDTSTSLPTTDTINKLSTTTDIVEPYNILSTEHIESLSQTNTIPKDTSTSLPTGEIKSIEAPLALSEYIIMKPTEKFQGKTITFDANVKTTTETDMALQSTTPADIDSLYTTSSQTENITLPSSLSISPISATDSISAVGIKNEINDINTASNDDDKTLMNIQSVTTNKLSKQSDSLPTVKGHTDKIIPSDKNTFTSEFTTTTATMDPNNIMTKDRLLLTNTIPMDTTTSLAITKITSFENYPGETIPNNINDIRMTETDMPLQSTPSDLSLPTVDSLFVLSVENIEVFNNSEQVILPDTTNNHTVPDSILTSKNISSELYSTVAVGDVANINGTDVWNKNENEVKVYSLNKAIDDTIERNILTENITSTSTPYTFTVRALLLTEGNISTVDIVENLNESSLKSHVITSNFYPETAKLTQKSTTADTNKNTESTSETPSFQWTSPTIATDTIYDVTMTESTIAKQLTDNVNLGHASNSKMLLSNAITEAMTAHSEINNNTVRDSVDLSVNVKRSNVQTSSPNSISDIYSRKPSTSKPVKLENSILIQDLAQTTKIFAATDTTKHNTDVPFQSPEYTLFTQNSSTMQITEDELVGTSTNNPLLGENNVNKTPHQVFVTRSYAEPVISPLENVAINSSSSTIKNREPMLSIASSDLTTTTLGDRNEKVIAGINLSKFANTSLGGNKSNNIINTELNYTTSNANNESNNYRQSNINPPLELILRVINSSKITTASKNSMPIIKSSESTYVPTYVNNVPNQESLSIIKAEYKENNNLQTDISTEPFISDGHNLKKTISIDEREPSYISQAENKTNFVKTEFTPVPLNLSIGGKNLFIANESSNQKDKHPVVTPKMEILEKPKGTTVTSTSSSSAQTEDTIDKNNIDLFTQTILSSENQNTAIQFVTERIKSELPHTIAVAEISSKQSIQINDIPKTTYLPYDETTQLIGNELTAQEVRLENFTNTPAPVSSDTTVTKPLVAIDLLLPIINLDISTMKSDTIESADLEKFKVTYTAQNVNPVDSSTFTDQLPLSGTEMSSDTVNKIKSLDISTTTTTIAFTDTNQGVSKTSNDTVAAIRSTNLEKNYLKRTDDSLLFIKTDNNVPIATDSTSSIGLRLETWKGEIKNNANTSNKVNKGWELVTSAGNKTSSILQKTSLIENRVDNATQTTLSSSLSDLVVATDLISSTDFLVNNNTENTHSGIISLITPPTNQQVTKEKEKSDNKASKVKQESETSSHLVEELVPVSNISYIPSLTSAYLANSKKQRDNSTKEELLIQKENNHLKPTAGISREALYSTKISKKIDTGTKTAGSESNKEKLTLDTIENSTSTNGSRTSNSKSKDQNSTVSTYNTTVISNDQSGTPRYTSYTKSTAVGDGQITELPAFESELNFTCKQKKRGKYADELNCRKFYICLGNSHIFEGTCPVNTVFSEIRKQCTKNLSHCIRNNQFRCVTEGRFGDFLNDNVYYICAKNNVTSFIRFKLRCQNGYYLNKTSVRCVLNNESQQSSSSSDSSKNSSDQSAPSASKQEVNEKSVKKFKCKKEGIFADPSDCQRYFECKKSDNSEYRQKRKKCGNDQAFNRDEKKCVDDDSYECK